MIEIQQELSPAELLPKIQEMWAVSGRCIDAIESSCPPGSASPVFTIQGRYTAQGWTEWTQGFQYGSALLQFDATGDPHYLELGRDRTVGVMAPHVTHMGVHDHGFNNVSTYGNLLRLMGEGRIEEDPWQRRFYRLALMVSGAVQAARWTETGDGTGYIYSFNGPQSLFVDTIRSCRALAVAHQLGHVLMSERDAKISLFQRLVEHAVNTARYNIWYGDGCDAYDLRGRTAHESVFNTNNGDYRCASTQQGYSALSTWTRGLAWAMLGFAEQLEWLATQPDDAFTPCGGRLDLESVFLRAAAATCDFYIDQTPTCGVPYWDTGAPGLVKMPGYLDRPADPYNAFEPVDSSAAAIGAQGLLRLGRYLEARDPAAGSVALEHDSRSYFQAGLTVLNTLLDPPYLATDPAHEGLILHSVYHRPNGWDHIPDGQSVPCGESSMWGDYHAREAALYVQRLAERGPYYTFFGHVH